MVKGIGFLLAIGIAVTWMGVKYFIRLAREKQGDRALTQGDAQGAIKRYKSQLLSVLEIGPSSMNKNDPKIFFNDIPRAEEVLEKLELAYETAGITYDGAQLRNLFEQAAAVVDNKEFWNFAGLKRAGQKEFQTIRRAIESHVKTAMP